METSQSTGTVSEEYHKAKLEEYRRLCQLPVWFHSSKQYLYKSVSN